MEHINTPASAQSLSGRNQKENGMTTIETALEVIASSLKSAILQRDRAVTAGTVEFYAGVAAGLEQAQRVMISLLNEEVSA